MNIFLQIGLGLIPGAIIPVVLMIKRKALSLGRVLFALLMLVLCAGCICFGTFKPLPIWEEQPENNSTGLSSKELMTLANAFTVEGALNEAAEVLDIYSQEYGYDEESRLLNARIALREGRFDAAAGLYQFLNINSKLISEDSEELEAANLLSQNLPAKLAMYDYMERHGENPEEYGYVESDEKAEKKYEKLDEKKIDKIVRSAIEEEYKIPDEIEDIAEAVAKVSAPMNTLLGDEKKDRYYKTFDRIAEEYPEYMNLEVFGKAKIKADVLAEKYDNVVRNLSENSTYHELMIASELYINDIVRGSDFPDEFTDFGILGPEPVEERIDAIYENISEDMGKTERRKLKERIKALSEAVDEPELMTLKSLLAGQSAINPYVDESKVYLEIAKIEDYLNNESSSNGYFSDALYSANQSEDAAYADAMGNVVNIIQNKEDSEAVKLISEFVDKALQNSLTVDVGDVVPVNEEFEQNVVDYSSMLKAAVSIGYIYTESFPQIISRVQISSNHATKPEEIKASLKVTDCGIDISEFELSKVDYDESNIMLVCDISGSMSGNMSDLKTAVATFVEDAGDDENIGVVTFSNSICDIIPLGSSKDELLSFAEAMGAGGGTDMYNATLSTVDLFDNNPKHNNVIILMSDGQDNNPKSLETIKDELGAAALSKGVTIYTLGLGSGIDAEYLSAIASCANGSCLYVEQADSLEKFYENLHAQVYNQYELKYTAVDTTRLLGRTLEISLPDENKSDIKTYNLKNDSDVTVSGDLSLGSERNVTGLDPNMIYQTKQEVKVKINGGGFTATDKVTVKLDGTVDYTMDASFVDSDTLLITVPSNISLDVYDVIVTCDNKSVTLKKGFSVVKPGSMKSLKFGPYTFTAADITSSGNQYELTGNVTMNGWLKFNGSITVTGDVDNGTEISVSDYSGSRISIEKNSDPESFAYRLAKSGKSISVPALGDFRLYNDYVHITDYENYLVDDIRSTDLEIASLILLEAPYINIYPDCMSLKFGLGTTMFPYQEKIMNACYGAGESLFKVKIDDGEAIISNENVGLVFNMEAGNNDDDSRGIALNFFNSPVEVKGGLKAAVNTYKDEYSLEGKIKFEIMDNEETGVGGKIGWKDGGVDDVKVVASIPVKIKCVVPTELTDFSIEAGNLAEVVKTGSFGKIELTGGLSVKVGSLDAISSFLGGLLDHAAILEIPNAALKAKFSPFGLNASADVNLLGKVKLGHAEADIGKFNYPANPLISFAEPVIGGRLETQAGVDYDSGHLIKLKLMGNGEANFHTKFVGMYYNGEFAYDIGFWSISDEDMKRGDAAFGYMRPDNSIGELFFTFKYTEDDKIIRKFYYIDDEGHMGTNHGTL